MTRRSRGFTLVELIIASALGLLLLTITLKIFIDSRETIAIQQALLTGEGEGAVALDLMVRDLRSAGNWGCQPRKVDTAGLAGNNAWTRYTRPVEAWPASRTPSELLPATLDLLPDSDVLAVRLSADEQWPALAITGNTVRLALEQRESGRCGGHPRYNGLCPGDYVLVSHCGGGRITRITHTATNGADSLLLTLDPPSPPERADTAVRPVHTRVWFMAQRRDGSAGLFMREGGGRSREVADGEHMLELRFATPGAAYAGADAIGEWPAITAVMTRLHWHAPGGPESGRPLETATAIRNRLR